LLPKLNLLGVGVEAIRIRMRMIANARPTTDVESTDRLFDKLPWISKGTARSKQTAAE